MNFVPKGVVIQPDEIVVGGRIYKKAYVKYILKNHTARECLRYFPGIHHPTSIRVMARRAGMAPKPDPRRKYNPEGNANGGRKEIDTICWDCANATNGNLCPWVKDYTPVEGWDAIPKRIKFNDIITDSYIVMACPNFKEG